MRATHNLYLKKSINVKGNIADLGAGKHNTYYEYIDADKKKLDRYDFYKIDSRSNVLDLEKKFKLKKNMIISFYLMCLNISIIVKN